MTNCQAGKEQTMNTDDQICKIIKHKNTEDQAEINRWQFKRKEYQNIMKERWGQTDVNWAKKGTKAIFQKK